MLMPTLFYAKMYDVVDVCVGYLFCASKDGTIGVDTSLLNDVKEQVGGGREDLDAKQEKRDFHEIFIL